MTDWDWWNMKHRGSFTENTDYTYTTDGYKYEIGEIGLMKNRGSYVEFYEEIKREDGTYKRGGTI